MKGRWLTAGLIALLLASTAAAQKKSKQPPQLSDAPAPPPLADTDQIDRAISEMLGAWQVGDINLLHSHYAEDVTVVSGDFEPPVRGWPSYLESYQRQRQRLGGLRLDRRNSYIFVQGTVAWAFYQWEFVGMVDGKPSSARGHTTLVFEKSGDHWLIVHNHTSEVCEAVTQPPPPPKPGPYLR